MSGNMTQISTNIATYAIKCSNLEWLIGDISKTVNLNEAGVRNTKTENLIFIFYYHNSTKRISWNNWINLGWNLPKLWDMTKR